MRTVTSESFFDGLGSERKPQPTGGKAGGRHSTVREENELGRRARSTTGDIHSAGYREDRAAKTCQAAFFGLIVGKHFRATLQIHFAGRWNAIDAPLGHSAPLVTRQSRATATVPPRSSMILDAVSHDAAKYSALYKEK